MDGDHRIAAEVEDGFAETGSKEAQVSVGSDVAPVTAGMCDAVEVAGNYDEVGAAEADAVEVAAAAVSGVAASIAVAGEFAAGDVAVEPASSADEAAGAAAEALDIRTPNSEELIQNRSSSTTLILPAALRPSTPTVVADADVEYAAVAPAFLSSTAVHDSVVRLEQDDASAGLFGVVAANIQPLNMRRPSVLSPPFHVEAGAVDDVAVGGVVVSG